MRKLIRRRPAAAALIQLPKLPKRQVTSDTHYTPALAKRYLRLAGPFHPGVQESLLEGLMRYLTHTGARAIRVQEPVGVCVWRLRSECETLEQTEKRLKKSGKLKAES